MQVKKTAHAPANMTATSSLDRAFVAVFQETFHLGTIWGRTRRGMTSDGMKQETQMPLDINLTLYFTLQEYDIVLVLHWVLLEPFGAFCVIPVCRLVVVVVDTVLQRYMEVCYSYDDGSPLQVRSLMA